MYLNNLIAQGEHETLEFKYGVNDPRKIARTLVAFANTRGGRLLVGIKDNGLVSGALVDEEYYMVESGARLYSVPQIDFRLKIHCLANGKQVMEFIVESSSSKPHKVIYPDRLPEAYVRVHDENILAHPVWVEVQERMKLPCEIKYTGKHNRLLRYLDDAKAQRFETIMKEVFLSERETMTIVADLVVSNIVEIETTAQGAVFKLRQR
jgi:predicted HTH transcriptional regulator